MTKLKKKQRHQVKSRFYYLFWGAATVSVFAGQMYVGSGYRQMSEAINELLDQVTVARQRFY
jgi:5,10-methenyltetrahydromethanopterin hydrogenase|tara:strand:- start:162 stop:347 length:186 start_codon:yes stop_codon:yes gene_type:complete